MDEYELISSKSAPNSKMTPTEVLDVAEGATVRIQVDNENSGTGVILQKEGAYVMILTCYHVIERAIIEAGTGIEIDILFSNLHSSRQFKPVSSDDHKKDFGLLFGYDESMINMNLKPICSFAEIEDASQEIFCCSFPYGIDYAIRVAGRLSQVQLDDYIAYDLGVAAGSSGAAILNDRAQILAVHIKGYQAPVYAKDDELTVIGNTGGVVKYGMTAYEISMELKHLTIKLSKPDLYHQSIDDTIVNLFMFFREEEEERARREKIAMEQKREEKRARREEKKKKKRTEQQ